MESEPVQPFRNRHLFIIPVCQTRRRFYGSNEVKPRSVSKNVNFLWNMVVITVSFDD